MRTRSPKVVGREEELGLIERALADAARGRGTCLFLIGEAGSGKTRLLQEADGLARGAGMEVLLGGAPAVAASPAFGLLAEALRSWTRRNPAPEALVPYAQGLRHILPEWPAPPAVHDLSEDQMHLLILEGALQLVRAAAGGRRGTALLLDDVHRADPETLSFLEGAAAFAAGEPVAVIAAIRSGEGPPAEVQARALEQKALASVHWVMPLDQQATIQMVEAILGERAPSGLIADIAARTDGLPLLIEELLVSYLDAGILRTDGEKLLWAGEGRKVVPRTTIEITRARLARLSAPARRAAEVGAVLSRFDPDLLVPLAGIPADSLATALRESAAAGITEGSPKGVDFRHALIREAVVETLLPIEREDLHRRAAGLIASIHPDDPAWFEERAYHLEATGDRDAAASLLVEAALASLEAHAPVSAENSLRRALALTGRTETSVRARDVLADTLSRTGRWEEALEVDAGLVADEGGSADRLARMAYNAVSAARLEEAERLIDRASEAGAEAGPLLALRALLALWKGDLDTAVDRATEALAWAEEHGDPELACRALDVVARSRDALGDRPAATAAFRRWADVADQAGLTSARLQALMELGNLDFMSGGPSDGLREARELAHRAGAFATQVLADLSLVWLLGHRALLDEAQALGDEAVRLCRHFGLSLVPHALVAHAWAREHAVQGAGEDLLSEAESLTPGDVDLVILAEWTRGDRYLRTGEYDRALHHYEKGLAAMEVSPSGVPPPIPFMRVCALACAEDARGARRALEEARAHPALPRLFVNPMWLAVGDALVSRDGPALREAVDAASTNGSFNGAIALVLGAEVVGGEEAPVWLREALEVFDGCGAVSDAGRVRRMLRSRGERVALGRRRSEELPDALRSLGVTAREAGVLRLVAQGLSNSEIAGQLFLSVRTVESHVSSLLRKLGAASRAGLVGVGLTHLETDPPGGSHRGRRLA